MLLIAQICLAVVTIASVGMALFAIFKTLWTGTRVETEAWPDIESDARAEHIPSLARASFRPSPRFGARSGNSGAHADPPRESEARLGTRSARDSSGAL